MRHLITAILFGTGLSAAQMASAYDLALIVGNEDYTELPEFENGDDVSPLEERLRRAGFEVVAATNADLGEMLEAADRFVERAPDAERLLVLLNGHFLKTERDWHLLPVDGSEDVPLARLPRRALSVGILMGVLAEKPRERAVMVLGTGPRDGAVGPYVQRGLIDLTGDYGFVLIGGRAEVAGEFAQEVLAVPGESFDVQGVRGGRNLAVHGLTDPPMTFIPADRQLGDVPEETRAEAAGSGAAGGVDRDYWRTVSSADTEQAYVDYLDRFPDGAFADEAATRLDAIRRDPFRRAREGEDDLNLGRDERRRVQVSLSVLDFDPRGVDGIFGEGTRTALSRWQAANGFEATGYLGADQLAILSEQAGRRVAEREAEVEARRTEIEREDRAYWSRTGKRGDVEGLQAYLERYPEGLFAEDARDRLAASQAEIQRGDALSDAQAWDEARARDRVGAYERYIERNPTGTFVEAARARIDALRQAGGGDDRVAEAQRAEEQLNLNAVTRGLIEGRLEEGGFGPGTVDGRFDEATRSAIRRYQESLGRPVTGYLSQEVVVQLLAQSILR